MAYDPNEPRDTHGEWTSGSGGTGGVVLEHENMLHAEGARRYALAASMTARELGFDPARITVTDKDYRFLLNGAEHSAAGSSDPKTGKITLYSEHLAPGSLSETVAHEVMHQQFDAFERTYLTEREAVMNLPHSDAYHADPMKADGTLREPWASQFPAYQARAIFDTDLQARIREDGCTPYSRDWWTAFHDDKTSIKHAVSETLSEMAALRMRPRGSPFAGPPTLKANGFLTAEPSEHWAALYNAVKQHWLRTMTREKEAK